MKPPSGYNPLSAARGAAIVLLRCYVNEDLRAVCAAGTTTAAAEL
ncbi:MAG: hypothetical protein QM346_10085 [Chloroflexota bacterium]|nr:hypothetical protein [Chloroflexota bacterium]